LNWLGELPCRVRPGDDLGGTAQNFLRATAPQIVFENLIRIVEIAENQIEAAEIIAQHGDSWIASGKLASLSSLAEKLPAPALEAQPRALAYRAEVARLRGDFESAQNLFRRAIAGLREKGDGAGEAEALHSLATIARRRGDYEEAFQYLDRAVELTPADSIIRTKCSNTRGLCFVTKGAWAAAEREFRFALQSAEEQHDEHHIRLVTHNLGLPAMMRGDFGEALRWLGRMLRSDADLPPIPQEATAHLNIARCHLYRGELEKSEQHLDFALAGCQLFKMVGQLGETFEAYGNLYRERADLARAGESYERAIRSYDEAGIDLAQVELIEERALMSLQSGDKSRALAQIDRLLERRPADKNPIGHFTAHVTRGRILLAVPDFESARGEFTPALEYFRQHGLYYYEAQCCIGLARCEFEASREPQTLEHLRRVLDLAARYDYEYWLRQEMNAHPAMFLSEGAQDLLPPDLRASRPRAATPRPQPCAATTTIGAFTAPTGIGGIPAPGSLPAGQLALPGMRALGIVQPRIAAMGIATPCTTTMATTSPIKATTSM
jgi:tetratricopeptide (TPR) repeat protein